MAGPRDALEHCAPVVAEVTGGAPLEGRDPGDGFGGTGREQQSRVLERILTDPGPAAVDQPLGERALRAHGGERACSEEGVAPQVLGVGGAVEEHEEAEIRQPRACLERVGGGNELLDERRRAHAPSFALRRASGGER